MGDGAAGLAFEQMQVAGPDRQRNLLPGRLLEIVVRYGNDGLPAQLGRDMGLIAEPLAGGV